MLKAVGVYLFGVTYIHSYLHRFCSLSFLRRCFSSVLAVNDVYFPTYGISCEGAESASAEKLAETPGHEASKRTRPVGTPAKTPSTKTPEQKRCKAAEECPSKKALFEDQPAPEPAKLLPKSNRLDSQETLVLGGCAM